MIDSATLARPDGRANVTVLATKWVPSPNSPTAKTPFDPASTLGASLHDALTEEWPCDAHFTAYEPVEIPIDDAPGETAVVRLDHDALDEGIVPRINYLVGDLDDPVAHRDGTPASDEWRAEVEPKLRASGLAWYRTRGGARVLATIPGGFTIDGAADAREWRELYTGWCEYVEQTHGLALDRSCKDWTRLYRLPNVDRDGTPQRARVHGRLPTWRPDREWLPPRTPAREAPKQRDRPDAPVTRTGDVKRDVVASALLASLGDWREYDGRKWETCGAVGGMLRKSGFTAVECADLIRAWLPHDEPGIDVEHGVRWACQAWERPPEEVSGIAMLAGVIGDDAASAFGHACELRWTLRKQAKERDRITEHSDRFHSPAEGSEIQDPLGKRMRFDAPEEPLEYYCEGLRLAPSTGKISIIAGRPGGGKGPLANHLAVCFATGSPVFGEHEVERRKVLLLDCEGARLTMRRLRRLARGAGVSVRGLDDWLDVRDASMTDLLSESYLDQLESYVRDNAIDVIVLDSYTSAMLGSDVDANSPQFALLAKALGQLGVLVIAVAHSNKAAGSGPPRLTDIAYSGAFAAMAQTAIVVHYPDDEDKNQVQVGCARAPETGFASMVVRFRDEARDGLSVQQVTDGGGVAAESKQGARALVRLQTVARNGERLERALLRAYPESLTRRGLRDSSGVSHSKPKGHELGYLDAALEWCRERGSLLEVAEGSHVRYSLPALGPGGVVPEMRQPGETETDYRARLRALLDARVSK